MPKLQPAVMTLPFRMIAGDQEGYIDISQSASLANRRFYRQGLQWAVGGMTVITDSDVTGRILIEKLPETWPFTQAWKYGFRLWRRMIESAASESEEVIGPFVDFKIYADSGHHTARYTSNLLPQTSMLGVGTANPNVGEWFPSKYVIPDNSNAGYSAEREIIGIGANYPGVEGGFDAVSLVEGYAANRRLPEIRDPNLPADITDASGNDPENWGVALFNEGISQDDAVLTDIQDENNVAPYPFENDGINTDTQYPGGANQFPNLQIHDIVDITNTTVGGRSSVRGGLFNCGLIKIYREDSDANGKVDLLLHLVPGTHRGYLANPMQEA